jgi:hypothetical protein
MPSFAKLIVLATPTPTTAPSASPSDSPSAEPSAGPSSLPSANPSFQSFCPESETETILADFQNFEDERFTGWKNGKISPAASSNFSSFLGPFDKNSYFPVKRFFVVDESTVRIFFQFDFYELDSWDGDSNAQASYDTFGVGVSGDIADQASFGRFKFGYDDIDPRLPTSGTSSKGIKWTRTSRKGTDSPQGCFVLTGGCTQDFQDQVHTIVVEVPRLFFSQTREVTLAMEWKLFGEADEFVGIDNVYSVACIDTVPSASPSLFPSSSPSNSPTDPPRNPPGNSGPSCAGAGQSCDSVGCCPGLGCGDGICFSFEQEESEP